MNVHATRFDIDEAECLEPMSVWWRSTMLENTNADKGCQVFAPCLSVLVKSFQEGGPEGRRKLDRYSSMMGLHTAHLESVDDVVTVLKSHCKSHGAPFDRLALPAPSTR